MSKIGSGLIDPAAIVLISTCDSQSQLVLDQQNIHRGINALARVTVLRKERGSLRIKTKSAQVWILRDETNCPTRGAFAIERALRSAKHLYSVQIVCDWIDLYLGRTAEGHVSFVDIQTDQRSAARVIADAADLKIVIVSRVRVRQVRHRVRKILQ